MAGQITDEIIEYVGILAKLELSEEEKEQAKQDMATLPDTLDILTGVRTKETALKSVIVIPISTLITR